MFSWPPVDMAALRERRMARVAMLMAELGVDHLVLGGADHIRYATDFRTQLVSEAYDWYAAVVDASGEADLFVPYVDEQVARPGDVPECVRALHPLPSWAPAACHPRRWSEAIGNELRRRGARLIGYEGVDPALLGGAGSNTRPVARELFILREIKDADEICLLEAASRANEAAIRAVIEEARPGMTDHELLARAAAGQHTAGAEFLTHAVCNVRKVSGSWFADGSALAPGQPFFLDIGCYGRGGYASDLARTGFLGEVPDEVRRAYDRLLVAHMAGQEAVRPGVRCTTVHAAINDCLARQGMPGTPYSTGHGVGLRACELPTIHRADRMDEDRVLRAGQVIALEPETTVEVGEHLFVLKVEDDFVVEDGGLRPLAATASALS